MTTSMGCLVRRRQIAAAIGCLALAAVAACSSQPRPAAPSAPPATSTSAATPQPTTSQPTTPQPATRAKPRWGKIDRWLEREASTCVLVQKDGRIVHESYFNGGSAASPVPVYSITKSLVALLVGAQASRGVLSLDDQAVPGTDVSIRSALAMTSGWAYSDDQDRFMIRSAADKGAYALSVGQQSPAGSSWLYNNMGYQLIEPVLRQHAPGGDVVQLARQRLLDRLGMSATVWNRDRAGRATMYAGVHSTCRDMARMGQLVLDRGQRRGRTLIKPAVMADLMTSDAALNSAYGLGWWVNSPGQVTEVRRHVGFAADRPPYRGRLSPDSPGDAVWAVGYGQQLVAVYPSQGVVAVRLGRLPSGPDAVSFDRFSSEILGQFYS